MHFVASSDCLNRHLLGFGIVNEKAMGRVVLHGDHFDDLLRHDCADDAGSGVEFDFVGPAGFEFFDKLRKMRRFLESLDVLGEAFFGF